MRKVEYEPIASFNLGLSQSFEMTAFWGGKWIKQPFGVEKRKTEIKMKNLE